MWEVKREWSGCGLTQLLALADLLQVGRVPYVRAGGHLKKVMWKPRAKRERDVSPEITGPPGPQPAPVYLGCLILPIDSRHYATHP